MITLRNYQADAAKAVMDYWDRGGRNPLVDMATGLGKSLTVGEVSRQLCAFADVRVLMLVHVQELVSQNFHALLDVFPGAPVGIYSAGLQKRQLGRRITYASIQSIYTKGDALGEIDVVLVDECHLIPSEDSGMYQTLFAKLRERNPELRVAGFTATPWRMGSGRLDQGKGRLFDEIVYTYGVGDGVRDGWLCPLSGYKGAVEFNVDEVRRAGGDFVQKDVNAAISAQRDVLERACDEIVQASTDRKSRLIFASGVKHAHEAAECMNARGIFCEVVSGKTPQDKRDRILEAFKRGDIPALANANVLTTGFDARRVDLIALLRSTLSTNLYVQIMGRGVRTFDVDLNVIPTADLRREAIANSPKPDCRILDYGGNIRRHGPVDAIWIAPKAEKGENDAPKTTINTIKARECPNCDQYIPANAIVCQFCGYEDPAMLKAKHEAEAERDLDPLSNGKRPRDQAPVAMWSFKKHFKYGADPATTTPTLRVSLLAGLEEIHEFIAFEHDGWGRDRAVKWWRQHYGRNPAPDTVDEAIERRGELRKPESIEVERDNNGFFKIVARAFEESDDEIELPDVIEERVPFSAFDDEIPF